MRWGLQTTTGLWVSVAEIIAGIPQVRMVRDPSRATAWPTECDAARVRDRHFDGAGFTPARLPAKVKPVKQNRLTDLRCAWRHATPRERAEFLTEVTN